METLRTDRRAEFMDKADYAVANNQEHSLFECSDRDDWRPAITNARERRARREMRDAIATLAVEQYIQYNPSDFKLPGLPVSVLLANLVALGLGVSKENYSQAISNTCRRGRLRRVLPGRLLLPEELS